MNRKLTNYPDDKSIWRYMSLCDECKAKAPCHVHTDRPITDWYPAEVCEICGKRGYVPKPEQKIK